MLNKNTVAFTICEANHWGVSTSDKGKAVWEFIYLSDRVSSGEGCEADVTARAKCGLAKLRECDELLNGRIFPLKQKMAIYKSDVRPGIMFECE